MTHLAQGREIDAFSGVSKSADELANRRRAGGKQVQLALRLSLEAFSYVQQGRAVCRRRAQNRGHCRYLLGIGLAAADGGKKQRYQAFGRRRWRRLFLL